jgi:hypothetical protein
MGNVRRTMALERSRLRRVALAAVAFLTVALGAPVARAQSERPLSRLEQESVDEALAALGLAIDPHPTGKTIGAVYVVNQDVFSRRDWYFQLLNIFHRTTRDYILRRELLFKEGRPYDQALVEESMRNLQSPPSVTLATGVPLSPPELSSVVAIVPVAARTPGKVDVLAVTRDVWSLRFNTNFEFQQNTLSLLDTSLSENNLFGWRKYLSFGFTLDLGKYALGPEYFDPNILGTRMQLYANAEAYYTRGTNDYEGNSEIVSLVYPLYSLASRWGAALSFSHQNAVLREFRGAAVAPVPLASDPTVLLPDIFRRQYLIFDGGVTRSFGSDFIQRIKLGYRFDDRHSLPVEASAYGNATPAQIDELVSEYAPISERRSEPYLAYSMFEARYGVFRDLNTFDLRENAQLGPAITAAVAYGAPELGADLRAVPLSASAGWTFAPHGGLARASVTGSMRLYNNQAIDQAIEATGYYASPIIHRLLRVVVSGKADAVRSDTRHTRFFLGGDNGLRGYVIGEFPGTSQAVGHVEVRSMPLAIWSQRFGTVLFVDAGDASSSLWALTLRTDAGIGLRWLIPQLNSAVLRVDWAVPLTDGIVTPAGLPGRASAGYSQVF